MQEDIQTHELKTPIDKHTVVFKNFATGYDDEAIDTILARDRQVTAVQDPTDPEKTLQKVDFTGASIAEADREAVRRIVLSVDGATGDGKPDGIISLVYSMHKDDAAFVKREVSKVLNPVGSDPEDPKV